VAWEQWKAGPVGRYLEVIDIDPPSRLAYAPVDLDAPALLACDGLPPSESDPRFHQQMVYAVAMRTIEAFEDALGRAALWAPRDVTTDQQGRTHAPFREKLRIHPHALREANAYYSPDRQALLFGYFEEPRPNMRRASWSSPASRTTSSRTRSTHALLDGLHQRMREPTNPDVLAFHEAFADAVALFQHFSLPEALRAEIARTRGDLGQEERAGRAGAAIRPGAARPRRACAISSAATTTRSVWRAQARRGSTTMPRADEGPARAGRRAGRRALRCVPADLSPARPRSWCGWRPAARACCPRANCIPIWSRRLADEAARAASHVLRMVHPRARLLPAGGHHLR
jgi:hypothetical protein